MRGGGVVVACARAKGEAQRLRVCSHTKGGNNTNPLRCYRFPFPDSFFVFVPLYSATMQQTKLSRKQIREGLQQVPFEAILGKEVDRELTAKQKTFALEVAQGATGADAYRKAYKTKGKPATVGVEASRLKAHPKIALEVEAYQVAIEAAKHRTPAQLRDLVIHSLVQVIIDPKSKPNQITQAAKVLGTVTEVAAFTERKEITHIKRAEDAKAQILAQLRDMMKAQAVDAVEVEAGSLLAELHGVQVVETEDSDTHRPATPQASQQESQADKHTVLRKGRADKPITPPQQNAADDDPTPSSEETPPVNET